MKDLFDLIPNWILMVLFCGAFFVFIDWAIKDTIKSAIDSTAVKKLDQINDNLVRILDEIQSGNKLEKLDSLDELKWWKDRTFAARLLVEISDLRKAVEKIS